MSWTSDDDPDVKPVILFFFGVFSVGFVLGAIFMMCISKAWI